MSSKKKPGCLESLRDYFKKSPNKIPIAIVASLQAVIIVGATILIFELDKANTFQEKTGYATIDLDVSEKPETSKKLEVIRSKMKFEYLQHRKP